MSNGRVDTIKFRSDSTFFKTYQNVISGINILQDLVGPEYKKDIDLIKKYISHSMKATRNSQIPDAVGKYYFLLQSQYNLDRLPTIETNDVVPEDMISLVSNLNPVYVPPKATRDFKGNFGDYKTFLNKYNFDVHSVNKNAMLIALNSMSSIVGHCINNNISSNIYQDDIKNEIPDDKYFETAAKIYDEIRSGNHNIFLKYDLSNFKLNNNISLLRRFIVSNFALVEEYSKFKEFDYKLDILEKNSATMKKISKIAETYDLILDSNDSLTKFDNISLTKNISKYKLILEFINSVYDKKESIYYMSNIYGFVILSEMKKVHQNIDPLILKQSASTASNEYRNIDWNSLYYNKRISYSKFPSNLKETIDTLIEIISNQSIGEIPDDFEAAVKDIVAVSDGLNFIAKIDLLQSMLQDIGAKSPITQILKSYIEKSQYINEKFYDFKSELDKITILESISNRELIEVDDLYFIVDKLLQDLHLGIDALRSERIKNNLKDLKGLLDTEISPSSLESHVNLEGNIKLFNYKSILKEISKSFELLNGIIYDISQINDEFGSDLFWNEVESSEFKLLEAIEILNSKSGVANQHNNFMELHAMYLEMNSFKLDSEIIEENFEFNIYEIQNIQFELNKIMSNLIDSVKTVASLDYSIEISPETVSIQIINNIMNQAKASKNGAIFDKAKQLLEIYNIYQDSLTLKPISYTKENLTDLRLLTNNINVAISEAFKFTPLEINDLTKQGDMYNEVYIPLFSMIDVIKKEIKLEYNQDIMHYNFRIIEDLDQAPLQDLNSMFKNLYILYASLHTSLENASAQLDHMPDTIQTMIANKDIVLASKFSKTVYKINDDYDIYSALKVKNKVSGIMDQINNQSRIAEILFSYADEIMLDLNLIKDYARYFRESNPDNTCVKSNDLSEYARYAIKMQLNQISNSLNAMWGNPTIDFRYEDSALVITKELEEFQKNLGISLNSGIKSSRTEMSEYYDDTFTHTLSNVDDRNNSFSNINKTLPVNKEVASKLLKDENRFKFPGAAYMEPMLPGGVPYILGIQDVTRDKEIKTMFDPVRDFTLDVPLYENQYKAYVNKFGIKNNSNFPYFVPKLGDPRYKTLMLLHDVEKIILQDYGITSIKNSGKGYFDRENKFRISTSSNQIYSSINRCEMISYKDLELSNPKFAGVGILTEGLGLYKHFQNGKFYYPIINRLNQFMGFGRIISYSLNEDAPIQIAFLMHDGNEITKYITIEKDIGRYIKSFDGFNGELMDSKPYRAILEYIEEGLLYAFNGYHYRLKTDESKLPPLTCKRKPFIRVSDSFINKTSDTSWKIPLNYPEGVFNIPVLPNFQMDLARIFVPQNDTFIEDYRWGPVNYHEWSGEWGVICNDRATGDDSTAHQYPYSPYLVSPLFNFGSAYSNATLNISVTWVPINSWDNEIFYISNGTEIVTSPQCNFSMSLYAENSSTVNRQTLSANFKCDSLGRIQISMGSSLNEGGSYNEFYYVLSIAIKNSSGSVLYSSNFNPTDSAWWCRSNPIVHKDPIHGELLGPFGLNSTNPWQVKKPNSYDNVYSNTFKQDFGLINIQNIVNKNQFQIERTLDFGIENANKQAFVELFYVLHDLAIPTFNTKFPANFTPQANGKFANAAGDNITFNYSLPTNANNNWKDSTSEVFGPFGRYEQNWRADTDYAIEGLGKLELSGTINLTNQDILKYRMRPVTLYIAFRIQMNIVDVEPDFRPKFIIYCHNIHECTFDPTTIQVENNNGNYTTGKLAGYINGSENFANYFVQFDTYINDEGKLPIGFGFKSSLGVSQENFDIYAIDVWCHDIPHPLTIKCNSTTYSLNNLNNNNFTLISMNDVIKSSRFSSDMLARFMSVVNLDNEGKLKTQLAFNSNWGMERASYSINRFNATLLYDGYFTEGWLGTHSPTGWTGPNNTLKITPYENFSNNIYSGFEIKGPYSNVQYNHTTAGESISSSVVNCNGLQFTKKVYSFINKNDRYIDCEVALFIQNSEISSITDENIQESVLIYANNIIVPYTIMQIMPISSTPKSKMYKVKIESRLIGNSFTLGFGFIKNNNLQFGLGFSEIMIMFNEKCDLKGNPTYWRSLDGFEMKYPHEAANPPSAPTSVRPGISYGPEFTDVQILPPKIVVNNSEPVLTGMAYIFNKFHRFNGQDYFEDRLDAVNNSSHQDAYTWELDEVNDTFFQVSNSSYLNGLVSIYEYDTYKMDVTVGSTSSDDDHIGVCIAFKRIGTTNYVLCVGTSQGRNGGGLGTTTPYRNGTGIYVIKYASGYSPTEWQLLGHTDIGQTGTGWANMGRMKYWIERAGNEVKVWCSNPNSTTKAYQFPTIDLSANALTANLMGRCSYGFVTLSQPYTTFYDINVDVESNGVSQFPVITEPGIRKLKVPYSTQNVRMLNDYEDIADKGIPEITEVFNGYHEFMLEDIAMEMLDVRTPDFAFDSAYGVYLEGTPTSYTVERDSLIHQDTALNFKDRIVHYKSGLPYTEAGKYGKGLSPKDMTNTHLVEAVNAVPSVQKLLGDGSEEFNTTYTLNSFPNKKIKINVILTCYGSWTESDSIIIYINGEVARTVKGSTAGLVHNLENDGRVVERIGIIETEFNSGGSVRIGFGMKSANTILTTAFTIGTISIAADFEQTVSTPTTEIARQLKYDCVMKGDEVLITLSNGNKIKAKKVRSIFYPSSANMFFALRSEYGDMWHLITPAMLHDSDPIKQEMLSHYTQIELEKFYYNQNVVAFKYASKTYKEIGLYPVVGSFIGEPRLFRVDDTEVIYQSPDTFKAFNKVINKDAQVVGYMDPNGYDIIFNNTFEESIVLTDCVKPENQYRIHYVNKED